MGASVISGQPRDTWRPPGGISLPPVSRSAGGDSLSARNWKHPEASVIGCRKNQMMNPEIKSKARRKKNEEEKTEEVAGSAASHQALGANSSKKRRMTRIPPSSSECDTEG